MDVSKIRLSLTDDREVDFAGLFAAPVDRVELERRYGVSTNSLGTPEAREEWILFLIFRLCARKVPEFAAVAFDDFLAQLASYEFVGGVEVANPTQAEPPIG